MAPAKRGSARTENRQGHRLKPAEPVWAAVDQYFADLLVPADVELDAALEANRAAGLPAIDVSPLQGKFLQLLVQMTRPQRVLEIGTLGGYSTIWIARALSDGGRIITLEYNPKHADVARKNLENAGLLDRIDLHVGAALDTLPQLASPDAAPFDLIFIDADKRSNPQYLEWALKLSRPGTMIVVDNVVRDGKVIDAESDDPDIQGTRKMFEIMAAEPRLNATVVQNVGIKGYDGYALAVVLR
ncbi:MAG TPA: O-methyltransferase [Terracidiphilus sp.]|jgi:predicted O-methyltransferase YrrM|nr:O-methyltransferase [Terracidiphilus sp.]